MAEPHTGSETIGAAGEKSSMTLFKDDRAEDLGAILLAVLAIALVVAISFFKGQTEPAATAPTAAPTPAPAGTGAPPTPSRP
jgi:hypothetical protein